MKRFIRFAPFLVLLVPFVALVPIGRAVYDWVQLSRFSPVTATERGFDWVYWQELDGNTVATFVLPGGPGGEAGIREGDLFFSLDGQQYFNEEQLRSAISGILPGSVRSYQLLPASEAEGVREIQVSFTRYPTFLYPFSASLWQFSIWSFTLAAFFHILGLIIVGPLAVRNRRARSAQYSLLLILASSFWIFGNLIRILLVESTSPPGVVGSTYDRIFRGLTMISILGWIAFPPLLLRKVLGDTQLIGAGRLGRLRHLIYVPTVLLAAMAIITSVSGSLGPITQDGLIAPILFYACCYVAAGAGLVLTLYLVRPREADSTLGGWSRTGSALTLVVSLLAAFLVLRVVPVLGDANDIPLGWLIVSAQLLSLAPVILVSLATLRRGKIDQVLSRALTYLTVLGLIFFAFVGGMELLDPYLRRIGTSNTVVAGLYVVLLLIVFERLARRLRIYAATFFATDRQALRQQLTNYQKQIGTILDHLSLAQQTVEVVGRAFEARFAALYLKGTGPDLPIVSAAYHPEPPFLTEPFVRHIWPAFDQRGRIWAQNVELNEVVLSEDVEALLKDHRVMLAIPIMADADLMGLLMIGDKKRHRAVYNLEDVDLLRSLGGQLALAVERLHLVERERALVRESAEAELVALRAQINPHFLFNALNTIISLIEERPEEAEATVEHLAAIFRHILHTSSRSFVTLDEELKLVDHYLNIERARFGDKLRVDMTATTGWGGHLVPAFVIQTLVENAVKHGLEKQRGGGTLRIACDPADEPGLLHVLVSDTGVGIPALYGRQPADPAESAFFGIGLRNVATRLEKLYGRPDLLHICSDPETGTRCRVLIPPGRIPAPETGKRSVGLPIAT